MSNVYLITGFPGFIASYLVQLLLSRKSGKIYLLVLPQFMEKAQNQLPTSLSDERGLPYGDGAVSWPGADLADESKEG